MAKRKQDAVDFLKRKYVGDDPKRQAEYRETARQMEIGRQICLARKKAGLNQQQLAKRVGTSQSVISRLEDADYEGHTTKMLERIAKALDTTIEVTLGHTGLQVTEQPAPADPPNELLANYPAYEMTRRGWLSEWDTPEGLFDGLRAFFGSDTPTLVAQFRLAKPDSADQAALACWATKVGIEADRIDVGRFSAAGIQSGLPELVSLSQHDEGPLRAVAWLEERGLRCMFVRHLGKTYLDGGVVLADDGKPAIGLTLRYDRLDSFWFTLLHEVGHVLLHRGTLENGPILDEELGTQASEGIEQEADCFAKKAWVTEKDWIAFRNRVGDRPRLADIEGFAGHLAVAPALVAGRLRYELKKYTHYGKYLREGQVRKMIAKEHVIF